MTGGMRDVFKSLNLVLFDFSLLLHVPFRPSVSCVLLHDCLLLCPFVCLIEFLQGMSLRQILFPKEVELFSSSSGENPRFEALSSTLHS
jgi:hypothetical protein